MCGIIGCIGKSKNKDLSFKILTYLARENQARGPHSTGHFLVDDTNNIDFFKSPIPACMYVNSGEWNCIKDLNINSIIIHSRWKSQGEELENENNHPHISKSENVGLIHNGTIVDYKEHKSSYQLSTSCDTELILKIILKENNIKKGIEKVYELLGQKGSFSCLLLYRNPDEKEVKLYYFRDFRRPGRFIDASEILGQYFFCSVSKIWKKAILNLTEDYPEYKELELAKLPIQIIPSYEYWEIPFSTMEIIKQSVPIPEKVAIKKKKKEKYKIKLLTDNYGINISGKSYISKYEYKTVYPR